MEIGWVGGWDPTTNPADNIPIPVTSSSGILVSEQRLQNTESLK